MSGAINGEGEGDGGGGGGWSAERVLEVEGRHTSGLYQKRPIALVRGSGALVWDAAGKEYIDCDTGRGVAVLGHCHPAVVAAVAAQSAALLTCGESFFCEPRARLLDALVGALPAGLDRIFLCNSGAEANEAALKFALLTTGRRGVVAARQGFHGRTMGALSATWNPKYREPFLPLLEGFAHVAFNDGDAAAAAVTTETAAVIVEPVQGESGVIPADPAYLARLRRVCDEHGAMLIFDEVQTGMGRTGAFVAAQGYGVTPDLITLAKGLGGGLPIGAVAFGRRVGELPRGTHASTFGGNPVACAAAAAAVAAVSAEGLAERARVLGEWLQGRLAEATAGLRVVREVRGRGLMVAVDLRVRSAPYLASLERRGVLALSAGPTVIRLLPPLVITEKQLETVVSAVAATLREPE
jgi:acetylornithine/LysW-gamma-L-lysine aminotransferase